MTALAVLNGLLLAIRVPAPAAIPYFLKRDRATAPIHQFPPAPVWDNSDQSLHLAQMDHF